MSTLDLDGTERKLNSTFDGFFEAEKYPEEFGEGEFDIGEFLKEYQKNTLKPHWIKRMLWLLLFHDSPELTPKDVEQMLRKTDMNILEIAQKIMTVAQAGAPIRDENGGEKKKIITKVKSKQPKGK